MPCEAHILEMNNKPMIALFATQDINIGKEILYSGGICEDFNVVIVNTDINAFQQNMYNHNK
jgi:hypothetical protein